MEAQQMPQQLGPEGYYDDPYQAQPSAPHPAAAAIVAAATDLQADEVFDAADTGPDLGQRDQDDLVSSTSTSFCKIYK